MDTPSEYSVGIHVIRWYHPVNIGWAVHLINGYTQWIFSGYPPDPMVPPSEYSVGICLIRRYHSVNIKWAVHLTNRYTHWIFSGYPPNPMAPPIQYWITFFSAANPLLRSIEYSLGSCGVVMKPIQTGRPIGFDHIMNIRCRIAR